MGAECSHAAEPPLPPLDLSKLEQETVTIDQTSKWNRQAKWESVPPEQKEKMRNHVIYYLHSEKDNFRNLNSIQIPGFRWKLCEGFGIPTVSVLASHAIHEVLKEIEFPYPQTLTTNERGWSINIIHFVSQSESQNILTSAKENKIE